MLTRLRSIVLNNLVVRYIWSESTQKTASDTTPLLKQPHSPAAQEKKVEIVEETKSNNAAQAAEEKQPINPDNIILAVAITHLTKFENSASQSLPGETQLADHIATQQAKLDDIDTALAVVTDKSARRLRKTMQSQVLTWRNMLTSQDAAWNELKRTYSRARVHARNIQTIETKLNEHKARDVAHEIKQNPVRTATILQAESKFYAELDETIRRVEPRMSSLQNELKEISATLTQMPGNNGITRMLLFKHKVLSDKLARQQEALARLRTTQNEQQQAWANMRAAWSELESLRLQNRNHRKDIRATKAKLLKHSKSEFYKKLDARITQAEYRMASLQNKLDRINATLAKTPQSDENSIASKLRARRDRLATKLARRQAALISLRLTHHAQQQAWANTLTAQNKLEKLRSETEAHQKDLQAIQTALGAHESKSDRIEETFFQEENDFYAALDGKIRNAEARHTALQKELKEIDFLLATASQSNNDITAQLLYERDALSIQLERQQETVATLRLIRDKQNEANEKFKKAHETIILHTKLASSAAENKNLAEQTSNLQLIFIELAVLKTYWENMKQNYFFHADSSLAPDKNLRRFYDIWIEDQFKKVTFLLTANCIDQATSVINELKAIGERERKATLGQRKLQSCKAFQKAVNNINSVEVLCELFERIIQSQTGPLSYIKEEQNYLRRLIPGLRHGTTTSQGFFIQVLQRRLAQLIKEDNLINRAFVAAHPERIATIRDRRSHHWVSFGPLKTAASSCYAALWSKKPAVTKSTPAKGHTLAPKVKVSL